MTIKHLICFSNILDHSLYTKSISEIERALKKMDIVYKLLWRGHDMYGVTEIKSDSIIKLFKDSSRFYQKYQTIFYRSKFKILFKNEKIFS